MCAHTSKKFLLFSLNKFADKVCTIWKWSVATEVCKLSKFPRMLFQIACCFKCMSVPAPKSFLTLVFEDVSTFSFLWQSTSISLIDFVLSTLSPHLVSCVRGVVYAELCMRSCVCGSCGVVRGWQRGSADCHSHRTGQRHPPTIYRIPLFCLFCLFFAFFTKFESFHLRSRTIFCLCFSTPH